MKAICRVCELLDNDKTIKDVTYCETCDAMMCKECEGNWLRRGRAAILEEKELIVTNLQLYIKQNLKK